MNKHQLGRTTANFH